MELALERSRKAVAFSFAVLRRLPSGESGSSSGGLYVLFRILRLFHIFVRSLD